MTENLDLFSAEPQGQKPSTAINAGVPESVTQLSVAPELISRAMLVLEAVISLYLLWLSARARAMRVVSSSPGASRTKARAWRSNASRP